VFALELIERHLAFADLLGVDGHGFGYGAIPQGVDLFKAGIVVVIADVLEERPASSDLLDELIELDCLPLV